MSQDTDKTEQTDEPDFETAIQELESLVARLEQGDLSLEESLRSFERGIALTRSCQQALRSAEQKVETLVRDDNGQTRAEPLEDDEPE
ncbi:exodeoxyribonuclease VII small subunit [Ectothiorhodospiraceae bacterium WFHF3C12]|nr:exodeoxyribonuclease VII small subunit [Ectothiorhodospiraceae bacterium WFHF3C12]